MLSEHKQTILNNRLGLSAERIAELKASGVD